MIILGYISLSVMVACFFALPLCFRSCPPREVAVDVNPDGNLRVEFKEKE